MKKSTARILSIAALNGFLATLFFALLRHFIGPTLTPEGYDWFQTAILLQALTTPGLLGAAILAQLGRKSYAHKSELSFIAGLLLFCGSVYMLAVEGPGSLGPLHWLTPLGGLALMLGWGLLSVGALRSTIPDKENPF